MMNTNSNFQQSKKKARKFKREREHDESRAIKEKYARGPLKIPLNSKAPKRLRKTISENQEKIVEAATINASTEILLPTTEGLIESNGVKTYKLTQSEFKLSADLNSSKHVFSLNLPHSGPYKVSYSRNGRYMLMCGFGGHVASMDCQKIGIQMEINLMDKVYDGTFLHNESFFATAQSQFIYVYDAKGTELHCLRRHERPYCVDFLPYHQLLTSVGHSGWIKWHDISTGEYVSGYATGYGPCKVMKHNGVNGISALGHNNGVVSMWSPSSGKALITMFVHKSPVLDLAFDRSGTYMMSSGLDGLLKVWDTRNFKCLHVYMPKSPVFSIDISDTGLVGIVLGREAQVLRNAFVNPLDVTYVQHEIESLSTNILSGSGPMSRISSLKSSIFGKSIKFRPFEDVATIGHSHGICNIIVPGSGEPNFDSMENNPFATNKQKRETEIQNLISKLTPEMINLDQTFVGSIDKDEGKLKQDHEALFTPANGRAVVSKKDRNRARGRNKISQKLKRRQKNVIDSQLLKYKEKLKESHENSITINSSQNGGKDILNRFR